MELTDLSPAIGTQVTGIDLTEQQPQAMIEAVVAAWHDRHLILVRDQKLDAAAQERFASWFGPVNTRGLAPREDGSAAAYISNTRSEGVAREGSLLFHQDHCFLEQPLPAICLYAEEAARTGGDTLFANAVAACERLPDDLRREIAGLRAVHVYDYASDHGNRRFRLAEAGPDAPRAEHPVVWPHPETGRPILYVNQLMTDSIVGLAPADSDRLLDRLFDHILRPELTYRHQWRVGDVLIWDNRALQHARTDFPAGERRSLRRLQVG
jgi:taurine dioxygenase